jgi:hypothetical protein
MRTFLVMLALLAPLVAAAEPPSNAEVLGRADLPSKVDASLSRQASPEALGPIRRVVDKQGRVIYTAEVGQTGRTIEVTADGKVVEPGPAR